MRARGRDGQDGLNHAFSEAEFREPPEKPVYADGAPYYLLACGSLGLPHYVYKREDWLYKVMGELSSMWRIE